MPSRESDIDAPRPRRPVRARAGRSAAGAALRRPRDIAPGPRRRRGRSLPRRRRPRARRARGGRRPAGLDLHAADRIARGDRSGTGHARAPLRPRSRVRRRRLSRRCASGRRVYPVPSCRAPPPRARRARGRRDSPVRYRAGRVRRHALPRLADPEERAADGAGRAREALGRLARERVRVEGASRTDAGVHADGQVVALRPAATPRAARGPRRGQRPRCPSDVRVLEVEEARPDFHARFDARWKEYRVPLEPRGRDRPAGRAVRRADLAAGGRRPDARGRARRSSGRGTSAIFAVRLAPRRVDRADAARGHDRGRRRRADGHSSAATGSCAAWCARSAACSPTWPAAAFRPIAPSELLATGDRRLLSPKAPAKG